MTHWAGYPWEDPEDCDSFMSLCLGVSDFLGRPDGRPGGNHPGWFRAFGISTKICGFSTKICGFSTYVLRVFSIYLKGFPPKSAGFLHMSCLYVLSDFLSMFAHMS